MNVHELMEFLSTQAIPDMEVVVAKKVMWPGSVVYAPHNYTVSIQPTAYVRSRARDVVVIGFNEEVGKESDNAPQST